MREGIYAIAAAGSLFHTNVPESRPSNKKGATPIA
jgi:hypothetical protein